MSVLTLREYFDYKERHCYQCRCGDLFDRHVWHCLRCNGHQPMERDECHNCYMNEAPEKPDTKLLTEEECDDACMEWEAIQCKQRRRHA